MDKGPLEKHWRKRSHFMIFALVGSGEYLEPMEPVDRYLIDKLKQPPRVVCLPTAAGNEGEERVAYWSNLGIDHFTHLGASVEALPVIDRESANNKQFAAMIAKANFIYLSGGRPTYLYDTIENTLVWKAILSVLEHGGILAGCSAGAMIMGKEFFSFNGTKSGFNFIPGAAIIPHFNEIPEARLERICQQIPASLTIFGIDGYTALIRSGDQYEVAGPGKVTVIRQEERISCTSGPLPLSLWPENRD
jgi:cyanophycinase